MNSVAFFKAALAADMSKLQWAAWATGTMQTLCFRKAEDDMSDSRLAALSGLRVDRARTAMRGVVGMGLFEVAGEGGYGTVYRIPERFLDDGHVGFSLKDTGKDAGKDTLIGQSETDAYADYAAYQEDDQPSHAQEQEQEQCGAYQALANEHQQLQAKYGQAQETIHVQANTIQTLVESNRVLVSALPKNGEPYRKTVDGLPENGEIFLKTVDGLPESGKTSTGKRLEPYRFPVTDTNKPLHPLTITYSSSPHPPKGTEGEQQENIAPEPVPKNQGQGRPDKPPADEALVAECDLKSVPAGMVAEYLQYRRAIRHPLKTRQGLQAQINTLDALGDATAMRLALNNTMDNEYRKIVPVAPSAPSAPTDGMVHAALRQGLANGSVAAELGLMVQHYKAKGVKIWDYEAAFVKWLDGKRRFDEMRTKGAPARFSSATDTSWMDDVDPELFGATADEWGNA